MSQVSTTSPAQTKTRGNGIAFICLVLGVITVGLAVGESFDIPATAHWAGVVLGALGFLVSMYAQMTSTNTRERWILMPGWILSGTFAAVNFWFAIN